MALPSPSDFNTYAEFCACIGIDTPEQLAAEARYYAEEAAAEQAALVAAFGPYVAPPCAELPW